MSDADVGAQVTADDDVMARGEGAGGPLYRTVRKGAEGRLIAATLARWAGSSAARCAAPRRLPAGGACQAGPPVTTQCVRE